MILAQRGAQGPIRNRKTAQKIVQNRQTARNLVQNRKPDKTPHFRISLSVINFHTYKLILLSEVLSGYSLVSEEHIVA